MTAEPASPSGSVACHHAPNTFACRFKSACRALGLPNWPYRRRKSVQSLLQNLGAGGSSGKDESEGEGEGGAAEVVRILKAEDEALLKEPTKKLNPDFKKLRQVRIARPVESLIQKACWPAGCTASEPS